VLDTGQFPFEALQGAKQEADRSNYENLTPTNGPVPRRPNPKTTAAAAPASPTSAKALAARLMHAEKIWNYDAFFAYVDRWMYEDDTDAVKAIKDAKVNDYTKQAWARQKQCDNPWVEAMWAKYRAPLGDIDDWKTPRPGATGQGNPKN